MTDFRADLHCHSTCSDGTDSPEALVQLAVDAGLSGLSITDHDTVAAYATAGPLAETLGLRLLPGCEFST
ncbi:MAG: PHP domain-containing protein, partial [Chlamydiia bacterium]|nr:PHP domain-containing protein [Chlamydiia bacterium]